MVNGVDCERGSATAGGRGYYLLGPMVFLEQVLSLVFPTTQLDSQLLFT